MKEAVLAKRYMHAFVNSCPKSGREDHLVYLMNLGKGLAQNPDAFRLLTTPMKAESDKMAFLKNVFKAAQTPPNIQEFMQLLLRKKRIRLLPVLVLKAQAMLNKVQDKANVEIATSSKLGDKQKADLVKAVESLLGRPITPIYVQDRDILGGFKLKIGNLVYDASVGNALENLNLSFN